MNETKKQKTLKFLPLLIPVAFFLSFSLAAYFYISAEKLIVSKNADEIKSLTSKLSEKENEITELKYQLERITALYEEELLNKPLINIGN